MTAGRYRVLIRATGLRYYADASPALRMKTFDNEWILEAFTGRPTFFTRRMFGGLAAYLHERQMFVLVEPTKTGRWKWHGVLICTDHEHHTSIRADFPARSAER